MDPADDIQILPTPDLGLPILYFMDDMDTENAAAAICTKIEGAGKVGLVVFSHNHVPQYKSGVNWIGDDRRLEANRPFRRGGCWDFVGSIKPRNSLKFHQDVLAKKAKAAEDAEKAYAEAVVAREKFQAERKKSVTVDK